MKRSLAALVALSALSLAGYLGGVYLLVLIVRHYPWIGPFVFVTTHGDANFNIRSAGLATEGIIGVLLFCFAFEAACLGINNSALKRLLAGESPSTRVDLFYIALRLVGGINVLAFVFSFGTIFWLANQIHRHFHIVALNNVHSYIIQFVCIYLVNTFLAYWGHRFMHTRWMWEIHKVHHAAEEMNVVTPFRNHPIDYVVMTLLNAFPVAVLGGAPGVVMTYYAVNLCYQSLVHSEINLKGKFWDIIWITPAAHRIHHSNRSEHWDTNFGIITLWDYVFGTYHVPCAEKLSYGVEGGETFNRPRHLPELFDNVRRWLSPVWSGLRSSSIPKPAPAEASAVPSPVETDEIERIPV